MSYKKVSNGKYKYEITEEVVYLVPFTQTFDSKYVSLHNGRLTLKKGYQWDGATSFPDFSWIIMPSAYHDAMYQLIRLGIVPKNERRVADGLFRDNIIEEDDSWYIPALAGVVYLGVRTFGGKYV